MSADLATQIAIRTRLVNWSDLTALVPAGSILDRHQRPAPNPSVILGESQVLDDPTLARDRELIMHTLHIWKREASLEGVKRIMSQISAAIKSERLDLGDDHHCVRWKVSQARAMRDPDGETSHGVLTVEVLVKEVTA